METDYGIVKLNAPILKEDFKIYSNVYEFMKAQGANVDKCDICSMDWKFSEGKCEIRFKFVHYSVPSAASEPYRHITFVE